MSDKTTIAIVAPGDMGGNVGAALKAGGRDVVTCLDGRGAETRARAERAGFRDLGSLDAVVAEADLFLSILPPAHAVGLAHDVAAAMGRTGARPVYMDCNAISPGTMAEVTAAVSAAGAPVIDCGIIGLAPGKSASPSRFYVSGEDLGPAQALAVDGILVREVAGGLGRASALKMLYAGINKARFSLYALVATAAEAMDLTGDLAGELEFSQPDVLQYMQRMIPRLPADSERWAPELEEIAATMRAAGLSGDMHQGAAWMLSLMAKTLFAAETRETIDETRSMDETLKAFVEHLPEMKNASG
jgi:3-hydroxyisobutyrate dehydrogenase-like beta-hydroxyacid dehydrogenase